MDKEKAQQAKAQGNEAFKVKDYPTAITHFTEAISFDPNDHVFYSNRSACYEKIGQFEKALDDGKKCVELAPEWARGYIRKGLAEYKLGKYEDALSTYENGLKLDPTNPQLKEGVQYSKEALQQPGGPEGAGAQTPFGSQQEIMKKLMNDPRTANYFQDEDFRNKLMMIQTNPQFMMQLMQTDHRFADVFSVITGINMADLQEAGEKAKAEKEKKDEDMKERIKKEEEEKKKKEEEEAEKKLTPEEREAKDVQKNAEEFKVQGNTAYKNKNFEEAISLYDKAFELVPTEPIYLLNKSAVYLEMKQPDECLKICDQAIELCNTQMASFQKKAKAFFRKGNAYLQMNKFDEAIDCYNSSLLEHNEYNVKEALKAAQRKKKEFEEKAYLDPEKAEEARLRGNEHFKAGNFPQAIKEYDEGIRRNPESAILYCNRAIASSKLMDFPSAQKDIEKCLVLDPTYSKAYAKKGNIHFMMKEYHKALDAYEKGLELDPTNEECQQGKIKTISTVNMTAGSMDQDRVRHGIADPEIQALLKDPRIIQVLKDFNENRKAAEEAIAKDQFIAKSFQKLLAAGVLQVQQHP